MGRLIDNLCDSCTNIGCIFQSGIVRTECAFYMSPHIEPDNCGNYVVMQPTVEAIPKADYEARLKADMAAMLTDIQISVAELDFSWMCDYADGDCIKRYAVVDIIQEKINALKGDQQQDEKIDTSKSDQGKVY